MLPRWRFWLVLAGLIALSPRARATITVLDYWRMGENDPGAAPGGNCTNTVDSVGGNTLTNSYFFFINRNNYPTYTGNTSVQASTEVGSQLAVNFGLLNSGAALVIPNLTNNFGIELWVNPAGTNGTQCIVYDGSTSANGCGLYLTSGNFEGLFGGRAFVCPAPAVSNTWTHVALVRDNGRTTLYTNGIAGGATAAQAPAPPDGSFLVGVNNTGGEVFTGAIDELRVFTFADGQFSTNDLLVNGVFSLDATNFVEGPAAGSDAVVLKSVSTSAPWSAATHASWLHLVKASGTGGANVEFSFDANPGSTRAGSLTIQGQTVTITQAGSTYVAAAVSPLVSVGLSGPEGVAVDGAGNVYIADTGNNAIKEWNPTNQTLTTLVSTNLNGPQGLAVDGLGDIYIADSGDSALKEWSQESLYTLVSSGLNDPTGVAVNSSGNVYIADFGDSAVEEWSQGAFDILTTLSSGPRGVAVDGGVVFTYGGRLEERLVAKGSVQLLTLVSSGLNVPTGIALGRGENIYIADSGDSTLKEWNAIHNSLATLVSSGLNDPTGVAVDGAGNVYIADTGNNAIKVYPHRAFLDPTPRLETPFAGTDSLPSVVTTFAGLTGSNSVTSDQAWLTLSGVTNGVASFAFTANRSGAIRTAHIAMLGWQIAVIQPADFLLGTTNLTEGPSAGTDSVVLVSTPLTNTWAAGANASWLHVAAGYQQGSGSTNILFSFDANPGPTRTGTLTIGGVNLAVTQAGSTYVAAGQLQNLPIGIAGVENSIGIAVDDLGNVYAPNYDDSCYQKWSPGASQSVGISNSISGAYVRPTSLAVDNAGNVYLYDANNSAIEEWNALNNYFTVLAASQFGLGQNYFGQLAADALGNVYFADSANNSIDEWIAASNTFTPLVAGGLNQPAGVAVDVAGNVYIADTFNHSVKEWSAATRTVTTLVTNVLLFPEAVAVDVSGNVYFVDPTNSVLEEWTAASGQLRSLASGLPGIDGVAVDALGNLYVSQSASGAFPELPRAFIDPTTRFESPLGGEDSLPPVLPVNESLLYPLNPVVNDQNAATGFFINKASLSAVGNTVEFSCFANTNNAIQTNYVVLFGSDTAVVQNWAFTPILVGAGLESNGVFQFGFTNNPGATFTVLVSTSLAAPLSNWWVAGAATNVGGNLFQFSAPTGTNYPQTFYRVRSP